MNLSTVETSTLSLSKLLERIVKDESIHARWLNTFSYLEYVGFRKIIKSQNMREISVETLTHAIEEGRHALRLKRLACRLGGEKFDRYSNETTICLAEAQRYIQEIDKACELGLKSFSSALSCENLAHMNYLYVTWLIEVRALEVYRVYANLVPRLMQYQMQSLIGEESLHLARVLKLLCDKDPDFKSRGDQFKRLEEERYFGYLQALSRELGKFT